MSKPKSTAKIVSASEWLVRAAYALVFVVNVQCAASFVIWSSSFAGAYELSGIPGSAAVRGIGVAFLMWNATYPAVIASPKKFKSLGVVVLVQQLIGLIGETWILSSLPSGHEVLIESIQRFISFDAFGLVIMTFAFGVFLHANRK